MPDRYTRFEVTRRVLLNVPTPYRDAEYNDYTSVVVSADPLTYSEMWEIQRNMGKGASDFTILVQPVC